MGWGFCSRWRGWVAKFHLVLGCFGLGLIFLQLSRFNWLVLINFGNIFEGVQYAESRLVAKSVFVLGCWGQILVFAKFRSGLRGGVAKMLCCKLA